MSNVITNRELADKIVEQFFQSKLTQRDFCKERSLNVGTFQWWIKRYRSASASSEKKIEAPTPFVRLKPQPEISTAALSKESELTIDFQNGTRLKWRGNEVPLSIYQLITSLNTRGGSQ